MGAALLSCDLGPHPGLKNLRAAAEIDGSVGSHASADFDNQSWRGAQLPHLAGRLSQAAGFFSDMETKVRCGKSLSGANGHMAGVSCSESSGREANPLLHYVTAMNGGCHAHMDAWFG